MAARIGICLLPAIGAAAYLFLAHLQLSTGAALGTHIDEYYYSACAVRGLHAGAVPGCHDNKGPLIYLVYEAIFGLAGDYNFVAVKLVAYCLAIADVALLAWIAFRLAGFAAAAVTAALLLSCLSTDVANMALRTDLVGGLFLSLALWVLSVRQAFKSYARLALAGLAIGTAVVAKQPFAFAGFAIILWLYLCEPVRSFAPAARFLARSAVFGLSVLTPFLILCLLFYRQNSLADFLASFFLYPMTYGDTQGNLVANFVRHAATMIAGFADQIVLVAAAAVAITIMAMFEPWSGQVPGRFSNPRWLFAFVLTFLLAALAGLPSWFPYYIVLAAGPMALLAGTIFGDYWPRTLKSSPRMALAALMALLSGTAILAAQTWRTNGKAEQSAILPRHMIAVEADASDRYAYQLGAEADFYAAGGFVPASSIQFSWALPGTPDFWSYAKPRSGTLTRQLLDRDQAQNLARLYRDFADTPPSYILLDSLYVRAAGSRNATDIPGFDAYLNRHCRLRAISQFAPAAVTSLYDCRKASRRS